MAERTSLAAGIMMAALGIVLLPKLAVSCHKGSFSNMSAFHSPLGSSETSSGSLSYTTDQMKSAE